MFFKRKGGEPGDSQGGGGGSSEPQAVLRDDLGLHHLWFLELRLREELARSSRTRAMFSVAAWQLRLLPGEAADHEYLARAAALICSNLRTYDIAARLDSERFAAILLDAPADVAATVAFRIKGDLQTRLPIAGKWQAGVAGFPNDGMDADSLIQTTLRRLASDAAAA